MAAYTKEQIRARVADLGQWFHDLDLGGVRTAPGHFLRDYPAVKWRRFAHAVPADHLRHPLLALDLIHEHVADDLLLFQTMQRGAPEVAEVAGDYDFFERAHFDAPGYPKLHFVEERYAHDPTNWWVPNAAAAQAMLRSAGFEIADHPEEEVYLCRRVARPAGAGAVYPARGEGSA